MKTFIGILFLFAAVFLLFLTGNNFFNELKTESQFNMEHGYFEGQKDALQGTFHVQQINDSSFVWTDSPWKDKKDIIYFPQPKTLMK